MHPKETSEFERALRCHEVTEAWTEAGITWNTQPATGTDHGTQQSTDDPQQWEVTSSAQAAFPGGRAEVRIVDDNEESTTGAEQAYASREGIGAEPELVVTFKREATDEVSTAVTVSKNKFANLDAILLPNVDGQPWRSGQRATLHDDPADGSGTSIGGLAYDGDRGVLWAADDTLDDAQRHRFHQYTLDGQWITTYTLDVESTDSPDGLAYDGTRLFVHLGIPNEVWELSIDDATQTLTRETTYDPGDEFDGLAYDPHLDAFWMGPDRFGADQVTRFDTGFNVVSSFEPDGTPESLAIPHDDDGVVLVVEDNELTEIVEYDKAGTVQARHPIDDSLTQGAPNAGMAIWGGDRAGPWLVGFFELNEDSSLVRLTSLHLASSLSVGNLAGAVDLTASVQPGNIPAVVDLASQVKPGIGGEADLSSTVAAQPIEKAHLAATVQPSGLPGGSELTSTVSPGASEVSVQARVQGTVAPVIVVDGDDFAEISAEVGSEITHTQDGASSSLRRVVQLVDTQTAKSFPREATSERGRASSHDKLGRGDAILYAKQGDTFQPGDLVRFNGLDWRVVGMLGWEVVGDVSVYEEVGLRRVSITAQARARGTVEVSNAEDLLAEVTVNVP